MALTREPGDLPDKIIFRGRGVPQEWRVREPEFAHAVVSLQASSVHARGTLWQNRLNKTSGVPFFSLQNRHLLRLLTPTWHGSPVL